MRLATAFLCIVVAAGLIGCASGPAPETTEPEPEPTVEAQLAEMGQSCADSAEAREARQQESSLYDRMGGYDGITGLINETFALHKENPVLSPRFSDMDEGGMGSQIKLAADFIAANTGGSEEYTGRTITEAHAALGVTAAEFLAVGSDWNKVMETAGLSEDARADVGCFFLSYKDQVIAQEEVAGEGSAEE